MATKNNGITRADALAIAIQRCEDMPEVVATLQNMHTQLTKPRKATVSKARVLNEQLAHKVHDYVSAHGDGCTARELVDGMGIPEITTTQKMTAVCRVACELGLLVRVVDGKRVAYTLA